MKLNINECHINEISSLEMKADELIEKETFDSAISALNSYCQICEMIDNAVRNDPKLKDDVNYILWKNKITSKINDVNSSLARMKFKSYET